MRVRLTADLTGYDARLVIGAEGVTIPGDRSGWSTYDRFTKVRFDDGPYLDVLWRSLETLDAATCTCPWEYPVGGALCGAPADWPVAHRDGAVTTYCLNRAQREVLGGQGRYYLTMGGQPITWADHERTSQDGP